jgi:hypothetical protein
MLLKADLNMVTQESQIVDHINQSVIKVFQKIKSRIVNELPQVLSPIIQAAIKTSITYLELVNRGELLGELGIANPLIALDEAIESMCKVEVMASNIMSLNDVVSMDVSIGSVPYDMIVAMNLPKSHYPSNGHDIRWFEWLVKRGGEPVVHNYTVLKRVGVPGSRTGLAVMRKSVSSSYVVPGLHQGTLSNNFVTRALNSNRNLILEQLKQYILRFK